MQISSTAWRHNMRFALACAAIVFLCRIASPAPAASSWDSLPPTPVLPAARAQGYVAVDDVHLYYARFGEGPPVLLLHGGLANSNYWGYVIPALVRRHFEVVVLDSRGHGRSSTSAEPYTYERMADDVLSALKKLDLPRVDLVGWSDGGIIGLEIAVHHPGVLGRLYVYGSNVDPSGVKDVSDSPTFRRYLERTRRDYAALSPTPEDYDDFRARIEAMWTTQPKFSADELRGISIPTTVADGAYDEAIDARHLRYMASAIPGAKLVILPDASHFGMLQRPSEFSRSVISFLTAQ